MIIRRDIRIGAINMIYISYNGRIWDFFLNILPKLRKHSFTTLNRNNTTEMHLSEKPYFSGIIFLSLKQKIKMH